VGTAKKVSSVNRLLRQIRRLKAYAAPLIAERNRRKKEWEDSLPPLAEDHLLRVILVFRYGEPRIDEPLALAYRRALSKLKSDRTELLKNSGTFVIYKGDEDGELSLLNDLRRILEREPPAAEDLKSKISTWVRQMPDWLRYLCLADLSMRLLGLEPPPLSHDMLKLKCAKSDNDAWPSLPEGILVPRPDYGDQFRYIEKMSPEELIVYYTISKKAEQEWTRREHRFMAKMLARG
jgi:hypothetical protein